MGNCLTLSNKSSRIQTAFELPSPLPPWPPGTGFGLGTIDLGGLQVYQITSFHNVWATHEGGPDNLGATFFEPSSLPEGFFMFGCYGQPNNRPLHGWVLAGKDETGETLTKPTDYTLVWSSEGMGIKQDGTGYIWLPVPLEGYKAMGVLVTSSPEKPEVGKIRCVRSDFTNQSDADTWIWGPGKTNDPDGFNVYGVKLKSIGTQAMDVSVGTFVAQNGGKGSLSLPCLKNQNPNFASSMPNLTQIESLIRVYSPWIYFHPDEAYLPSSVSWYFNNGAVLYKKGEESKPVPVEPDGSNLPQGGWNDSSYWLDLPVDEDRVRKGDLSSCKAYFHIKPMFGATFTDIAIWVFYPFNGPVKAKVEFVNISLGRIGQHVGDWEHVTLRISNFNGELFRVYFSEHSNGSWIDATDLEFQNGNKVVAYASLHGHAMYPKPGLVLQGGNGIGIRNDTAKSKMVMDTGADYSMVAADYASVDVTEPPWLNYFREWGPKISYDIEKEMKKVEKFLPGPLKKAFEKFVRSLPKELLGEEGPTGPKVKRNWSGDEI